ncbi:MULTISPECIES: 3'-5' exonuclease [unclassified Streptomyces]|uniref:3'-5' exonuclease n=1 Tax=unclassified Streptomyces TaxID=2593676 RepID=UPI002E1640BD|nr:MULTISPECIES: 3'-5' exonuclease [unclassified Streptomyces]WSR21731.1 AAA family ATPase [Streptomyces sp. NBC_01205]
MGLPEPVGRQSDVAYLPAAGHHVVLGTAGTGKTVMALLRALYLSDPAVAGSGRTLLVTYNNALVAYLKHLAVETDRLDIRTYAHFARGFLHHHGAMKGQAIAQSNRRGQLIRSALNEVASKYKPHKLFERDPGWFVDEIAWISGMGLRTWEEYEAVDRLGRRTPLGVSLRAVVWEIAEEYRLRRAAAGHSYDWHDMAASVRDHQAADDGPHMYRHVIIDEGQDLSPEEIRSLAEVVDPEGSVSFFGDYAQQIYGQGMSWRACGLKVARVETFKDNYRNSTAIAEVAVALSEMPFFGRTDELVPPVAPRSKGAKPTLVTCADRREEVEVVQGIARQLGQVGTVAVLGRTWDDVDEACAGLKVRRIEKDQRRPWIDTPGVYCTTYHSAKGLEFDAVLMPFCAEGKVPHPKVIKALGVDDADERESKLLYVGITRAKSELVITYSGTKTHLLPDGTGLFAEVQP